MVMVRMVCRELPLVLSLQGIEVLLYLHPGTGSVSYVADAVVEDGVIGGESDLCLDVVNVTEVINVDQMRKRVGTRMDTCGTPEITCRAVGLSPSMTTC